MSELIQLFGCTHGCENERGELVPCNECAYAEVERLQAMQAGDREGVMSTREQFEAWITQPPFERSVQRHGDDALLTAWPSQYVAYDVELAWEAWQAAANIRGNDRKESR